MKDFSKDCTESFSLGYSGMNLMVGREPDRGNST
jgi:hypothetical protein